MNFWDTVLGLRIAEMLEEFLSKKNNSVQYTLTVDKDNVEKALKEELKKGSKYVNLVEAYPNRIILIFEK